jgi:NAD(P)-dependent dehydrogenase (short-subunit alcohol dehydrogenase family)
MHRLDGRTAVVTGAGRGIGREISLLLADRGARVVVNDLGSAADGQGTDRSVAEQVVAEIRARGGQAVANTDSVASWEGGRRVVQAALDQFGGIDILVNNAGILRDRMFFKMTEEEWDTVLDVHLKGTVSCTRAAVSRMKEQRGGRLIHFSSTAGLIGNFGQTNDGAAKMAIAGFSRNLAIEMEKYGVTSNCIAPFAWTRLIATIPTDTEDQKKRVEKIMKMTAADVAPLAGFLAGDAGANVTGQIFGVRGKEIYLFSQPRIVRSIHNDRGWTVEDLSAVLEPTMKPHFTPLETSASYFSWDPLV